MALADEVMVEIQLVTNARKAIVLIAGFITRLLREYNPRRASSALCQSPDTGDGLTSQWLDEEGGHPHLNMGLARILFDNDLVYIR